MEPTQKKAYQLLGSALAFMNAAEFIRSHGEEGFAFLDSDLDREYKKAAKRIAKQLDKRGFAFQKKFDETGIVIDSEYED